MCNLLITNWFLALKVNLKELNFELKLFLGAKLQFS